LLSIDLDQPVSEVSHVLSPVALTGQISGANGDHAELMETSPRIPLREVISALSFALDLTEGAVPGHAIRCCLYGMRIAEELGLSGQDRSDLYYALLLKDIGCSSNAARMCQVIGGDDRQMKHDVKFLDWTRPSVGAVTALWREALPSASPFERAGRIVKLALEQHKNNREMITLRCDRGASIARKIGLSEGTAEAIRLLDEHWDGSGYPERRRGKTTPLLARVMAVAQHLDVFASESGPGRGLDAAVDEMAARSGRWFEPELVRLVRLLHRQGELARVLAAPNHREQVMQSEPQAGAALAGESIDTICEAFAEVVDAKSSYTYTHSVGVTRAAVGIAEELGFGPDRVRLIYRASLLHDLGKLSVSNMILDKPGKLNADEWAVMKRHSLLSEEILGRVSHFGAMARVAGQHHEKLDGSGYPFGLSGSELSLDSRVVAVADIYGALSEDRPYRPPMELEQIFSILHRDAPKKLDMDCLEALVRFLHKSESAHCQANL